jgi:hypothetical protein
MHNRSGWVALLMFNVGVEIGLLIFIAVVLTAIAAIRRIYAVPRAAVLACSYAIGTTASFWAFERLYGAFA